MIDCGSDSSKITLSFTCNSGILFVEIEVFSFSINISVKISSSGIFSKIGASSCSFFFESDSV